MIRFFVLVFLLLALVLSSAVFGGAAMMYTLEKEASDLYAEWMRRRKARRGRK